MGDMNLIPQKEVSPKENETNLQYISQERQYRPLVTKMEETLPFYKERKLANSILLVIENRIKRASKFKSTSKTTYIFSTQSLLLISTSISL